MQKHGLQPEINIITVILKQFYSYVVKFCVTSIHGSNHIGAIVLFIYLWFQTFGCRKRFLLLLVYIREKSNFIYLSQLIQSYTVLLHEAREELDHFLGGGIFVYFTAGSER